MMLERTDFSLSLSEWSFTICPSPYKPKNNVLSASLNKNCPSFLLSCVIPRRVSFIFHARKIDFGSGVGVEGGACADRLTLAAY